MPSNVSRPPLPLPSPPMLLPPPGFFQETARIGVRLNEHQTAQLGDYLARLLAMNEQMNLTSITAPYEAWSRHILDALTLIPHLAPLPPEACVLDVGSGGGVPGIPMAIARPDLRVTLLEATQKKAFFLSAVVKALGLCQVTVENGRAEQLAATPLRGRFDAVTARAVARMNVLLSWTVPFARPGGLLLFIKGQRAEEELREARKTLDRLRCTHERTEQTSTGRVVVLRVGGVSEPNFRGRKALKCSHRSKP
ncbi:MAG: 16S rRNA (guanine(527)-N(7))-methyltransferase RsmG [Myxococcales bacterium]|nr:16S rRNA (guanine(527)-N(7))-methyltransferase RsmG [Polyangiaceae bacterium]MDW8250541.1 16S rRNA (guanine(527)-N(7))-methyltransferase RsmG [Myxococcales bacterium]